MILQEWRQLTVKVLTEAGFDQPLQEAKWLLAGALKRENHFVTLNPSYIPSPPEEVNLKEWLKRRLKGEPLSRIKGFREFWSLPFHINEHTLDPRPETEILIEGVLKWVGSSKTVPWRILDLGTGSGCLLISLLHELKEATGIGVDINEKALSMARSNALLNKVDARATFQQGNWCHGLKGTFDIIVSNPPYISLNDKNSLEKSVLNYDPSLALFGGEDGLDCYRHLSSTLKAILSPQGIVILEIGKGQRKDVENFFLEAGFKPLFVLKDLANIERTIGFEILKQRPCDGKISSCVKPKENEFL